MSLENTVASYQIQIVRTGEGALDAVKDFQQVEAGAAKANAGLNAMNKGSVASTFSLHDLTLASRTSTASLRELHAVGMMIGMQVAPQFTMGVMGVASGLEAMRGAAILSGASLGLVGAALAGLVGGTVSVISAINAYKAKVQETKSEEDLLAASLANREKLLRAIWNLAEEEKLDPDVALYYDDVLRSAKSAEQIYAATRGIAAQIRGILPSKDQQKALDEIDKLINQMAIDTLSGYEKARAEAKLAYEERKQQLTELALAGGMSNKDAIVQGRQADVWYEEKLAMIDREETAKQVTDEMAGFERDLTMKTLIAKEDRVAAARDEYQQRVQYYEQLAEQGKISEDKLTELNKEAWIKRSQAEANAQQKSQVHLMSTQEMVNRAEEEFSQGFANAFVDFANGTKSAKDAFAEFAKSFLDQISKMIMQQLVLSIISKTFGSALGGLGGGGSVDSSGTFTELPGMGNDYGGELGLAAGGIRFAAAGLEGVGAVSRPTFFPRFNVIAGEAGREMMTVLARPRFMELGGVEAVVGQAGRNTLAITNAAQLAASQSSGGAGGRLVIEIAHSDQARARIISDAVQGAEVRIIQRAGQSSPVRDAIKRASA